MWRNHPKKTRSPERPQVFTLVANYSLNKTLLLKNKADNQEHKNEGQIPDTIIAGFEIFQLLTETRKVAGLSLCE